MRHRVTQRFLFGTFLLSDRSKKKTSFPFVMKVNKSASARFLKFPAFLCVPQQVEKQQCVVGFRHLV